MASPSELPGERLLAGKIRLLSRIGSGGMGDVWIARNEATHAEVAVKMLQRSERTEANDERFRREARLAATMTHRNVVRIFDLVDDEDGTLGLVMELLRGGTLEACMREHCPMSTVHVIAVAAPILLALNYVHQKGIVHRDVKPANIFFAVEPDGHVIPKVLDFGIAKLPTVSSSLTVDGSVLGTPHYMSPEQIRGGDDLDGRSDMFSLAVLLYEMLTGERVFQRDSAAASLAAVLEHQVDPDPRIEPRVWVALSRALAKRPYERFATCAEFADALRGAVAASEEDFALALRELSPRGEAIAEILDVRPTTQGSTSTPQPRSAERVPERKRAAWMLAGAGAATVLAVSATLAATRFSAPSARADDVRMVVAVPSVSATTGLATEDAGTVAIPSGTSSAERRAPAPPAPSSAALIVRAATAVSATRVSGGRGSPSPSTSQARPGSPTPIATSPGF